MLTYQPENKAFPSFYINCYNRGVVLSKADIEHYVGQLGITSQEAFYEPCSNLDIVRRAMRNLQVGFEKLQEPGKAEEVAQLLAILTDDKPKQEED